MPRDYQIPPILSISDLSRFLFPFSSLYLPFSLRPCRLRLERTATKHLNRPPSARSRSALSRCEDGRASAQTVHGPSGPTHCLATACPSGAPAPISGTRADQGTRAEKFITDYEVYEHKEPDCNTAT